MSQTVWKHGIIKRGDSFYILLPKPLVQREGFREGDRVTYNRQKADGHNCDCIVATIQSDLPCRAEWVVKIRKLTQSYYIVIPKDFVTYFGIKSNWKIKKRWLNGKLYIKPIFVKPPLDIYKEPEKEQKEITEWTNEMEEILEV